MRVSVITESKAGSHGVEFEIKTDQTPEQFTINLYKNKGIFYRRQETDISDNHMRFLPLHEIINVMFLDEETLIEAYDAV